MQRAHRQNPRMVPSVVVSEAMFQNLLRAMPDVQLAAPSSLVVYSTVPTELHFPLSGERRAVGAGVALGTHLDTREGITRLLTAGGREALVRTIDIVLR